MYYTIKLGSFGKPSSYKFVPPLQCVFNSVYVHFFVFQNVELILMLMIARCLHNLEQMQEKDKSSVSSGAIAGICVTVVVVIGLIIGVVIYRRYWRYPTARPFWTVELKDDHEGISFSSVPEDELVAITAREEEEERKRGKSGSQSYTKLRENI